MSSFTSTIEFSLARPNLEIVAWLTSGSWSPKSSMLGQDFVGGVFSRVNSATMFFAVHHWFSLGTSPRILASSKTIDLRELRVKFTFFFISLFNLIGFFFGGDSASDKRLVWLVNKSEGMTF